MDQSNFMRVYLSKLLDYGAFAYRAANPNPLNVARNAYDSMVNIPAISGSIARAVKQAPDSLDGYFGAQLNAMLNPMFGQYYTAARNIAELSNKTPVDSNGIPVRAPIKDGGSVKGFEYRDAKTTDQSRPYTGSDISPYPTNQTISNFDPKTSQAYYDELHRLRVADEYHKIVDAQNAIPNTTDFVSSANGQFVQFPKTTTATKSPTMSAPSTVDGPTFINPNDPYTKAVMHEYNLARAYATMKALSPTEKGKMRSDSLIDRRMKQEQDVAGLTYMGGQLKRQQDLMDKVALQDNSARNAMARQDSANSAAAERSSAQMKNSNASKAEAIAAQKERDAKLFEQKKSLLELSSSLAEERATYNATRELEKQIQLGRTISDDKAKRVLGEAGRVIAHMAQSPETAIGQLLTNPRTANATKEQIGLAALMVNNGDKSGSPVDWIKFIPSKSVRDAMREMFDITE